MQATRIDAAMSSTRIYRKVYNRGFSAQKPGEILHPIELEGHFELCRLVAKMDLDLTNDEVRHRVEVRIVERHFSELAARFVRWILPPPGAA